MKTGRSDNIMQLVLRSPEDVAVGLRDRFRQRRLDMNLSQSGLAERSGVNIHSLRRFEKTGRIALDSLLRMALVLNVLDDFERVADRGDAPLATLTLDDVLAANRTATRSRGRSK
jgi:transcriptional regulator with XRE-family HTH domain